jgi:hypothetical protein
MSKEAPNLPEPKTAGRVPLGILVKLPVGTHEWLGEAMAWVSVISGPGVWRFIPDDEAPMVAVILLSFPVVIVL